MASFYARVVALKGTLSGLHAEMVMLPEEIKFGILNPGAESLEVGQEVEFVREVGGRSRIVPVEMEIG